MPIPHRDDATLDPVRPSDLASQRVLAALLVASVSIARQLAAPNPGWSTDAIRRQTYLRVARTLHRTAQLSRRIAQSHPAFSPVCLKLRGVEAAMRHEPRRPARAKPIRH